MANNKNRGKLSVLFSKYIMFFAYIILLIIFPAFTIFYYFLDKLSVEGDTIICFLEQWKTVFMAASVCIWGFTLTCAIFLLGRLEKIYYGTSLKRIVLMCFGKMAVILFVFIYILLIPLIVITYYWEMWFTNGWIQIVNYLYSMGIIMLILVISLRDTVIELIRDRTIERLKKREFDQNLYNDEQFAVLNMIRNLDYDDAWQCDRLQSIIIDMILVAIDKNRLYSMYNVIFLIIQQADYKTREQKNRIVNILNNINARVIMKGWEKGIADEKIKLAIAGTIIPILQFDVKQREGKWISQLIVKLPWEIRKDISIILIFVAEYLYECGVYCKLAVDELLNMHANLYMSTLMSDREIENLKNMIMDCWLNLNVYNHQGIEKKELCENFINDYVSIDTRLCTCKILLDLQVRMIHR